MSQRTTDSIDGGSEPLSEARIVRPLFVEGTPSTMAFFLRGFLGGIYEYEVDSVGWTMRGLRIMSPPGSAERDAYVCAHLAEGKSLREAAKDRLKGALSKMTLITVSRKECDSLHEEEGRIAVDGDFPVFSAAGARFSEFPYDCHQLGGDVDLTAELDAAFDSLDPARETFRWNGHDTDPTALCHLPPSFALRGG